MPPASPNALRVTTPTDTTIVLTRTFGAPRQVVWEAMFTPASMRRWMMLPPGLTMTVCECDARVGGTLRMASRSEEADPFMTISGEFTEVVLHERAVHTETMALGDGQVIGTQLETHEFSEDAPGVTTMRITQTYPSKDARDEVIASGMADGMESCYARIDELLARGA